MALFRTLAFRAPPAGKAADGAGSTFAIPNLFLFDTMNRMSRIPTPGIQNYSKYWLIYVQIHTHRSTEKGKCSQEMDLTL